MLNRITGRFKTRERLTDEIRAILEKQEMAAERLVNYVRAGFAALSLTTVILSAESNTAAATKIFVWQLSAWIAYSGVAFLVLRQRDRYYWWLKYLSISVDITILHISAVGFLYNHSNVYEVFRSPLNWVVISVFNVMAGLRYSVAACLYSAALVLIHNAIFIPIAIRVAKPLIVDHSVFLGPGVSPGDVGLTVFFTAVGGVFAAVIASNSRQLILQSAEDSLGRERLLQDRDRLAKYFSKDVVDLVLNNPQSLGQGGQRMTATVLFADIRNFTQLSTVMQPEQVVELLNRYFSMMVDIIFKNGGTLDKFLGDGLMALFGVPYSLDKPEERAVRTALEMLEALQIMNRELEAKGMLRLDIGVGINAGPVVAGNIGSSQRHEYTVIGDTVNLAARLEALNKETRTQILVSASVYDAVRNTFRTRQLGPLRIRGKPEPLEVFAVMPPDTDLDATPASMIPASTSFV